MWKCDEQGTDVGALQRWSVGGERTKYRYVRIIRPLRRRQHFSRYFVPAVAQKRLSFTVEAHVQSQASPCGNVCARSGTGPDCSPGRGSVILSAICSHSSVPVAV